MEYTIRHTTDSPDRMDAWDSPVWSMADTLEIASFHPQSSDHRPRTFVRALHDDERIHVHFRVEDRYVRCTRTEYQSAVFMDSCVEFFVRPNPAHGYFNIETNCGGGLLFSYKEVGTGGVDRRTPGKRIPADSGRKLIRHTTLPALIDPECPDPVTWQLCYTPAG